MAEVDVRLVDVTKRFGDQVAVDGITLDVSDGEFFALLGPSGCGKTTTLRMIGGFEQPTSGRIELQGSDVTQLPAHKRDVNTVFQSYALFPHLTIFENVAFGLRRAGVAGADVKRRVGEALELLHQEGGQVFNLSIHPWVMGVPHRIKYLDEALRRARLYEDAGADVIFVESPESEAELERIGKEVSKPLLANMVEFGKTPRVEVARLRKWGFDLAIYPGLGFSVAAEAMRQAWTYLKDKGTSNGISVPQFKGMHELMGFSEVWDFEKKWAQP